MHEHCSPLLGTTRRTCVGLCCTHVCTCIRMPCHRYADSVPCVQTTVAGVLLSLGKLPQGEAMVRETFETALKVRAYMCMAAHTWLVLYSGLECDCKGHVKSLGKDDVWTCICLCTFHLLFLVQLLPLHVEAPFEHSVPPCACMVVCTLLVLCAPGPWFGAPCMLARRWRARVVGVSAGLWQPIG